jgi:phospholipid-binding lipoprotein MlaA
MAEKKPVKRVRQQGAARPKIESDMMRPSILRCAAALCIVVLSGCATSNPRDPFEPFNRAMYAVNEAVDTAVVRPTAIAYKTVTPSLVRIGVSNFFDNLTVPATVVNSLLQGKVGDAAEGVIRFSFNTLFGFAGVLDIASEMGIARRYEDFGQTLGRWGVPAGPYLVLPVLGPSTVRDTTATVAYAQAAELNPYEYIDNGRDETALGLQVIRVIDLRADLLDRERLLNELALDKYTFVRDTYLQRRRSLVYDGNVPEDNDRKPPKYEDDPGPAEPPAPSPPASPAVPAVPPASPPASPANGSQPPAKSSQTSDDSKKLASKPGALTEEDGRLRGEAAVLPSATSVSGGQDRLNASTLRQSE